jgi:hypothetical protein
MSLWKRAPRAVYRVYDEDEYLAGEHLDGAPDGAGEGDEPSGVEAGAFTLPVKETSGARFRRIGGVALLASATVAVAVLIATHSAHLSSAAPAARAERGSEPARALSARRGATRPTVSHAVASEAPSPRTRAIPRRTGRAFRRRHQTAAPVKQQVSNRPAIRLEQAATRVELPASPAPAREESSSRPPPMPPAAGAEFGFER